MNSIPPGEVLSLAIVVVVAASDCIKASEAWWVKMTEDPLKVYQKLDPELRKWVENLRSFAFKDGALPGKMKILIAMALDAAHGATGGVRALARSAMKVGATREEIGEALRVALFVCGVGSAYTAANALSESF